MRHERGPCLAPRADISIKKPKLGETDRCSRNLHKAAGRARRPMQKDKHQHPRRRAGGAAGRGENKQWRSPLAAGRGCVSRARGAAAAFRARPPESRGAAVIVFLLLQLISTSPSLCVSYNLLLTNIFLFFHWNISEFPGTRYVMFVLNIPLWCSGISIEFCERSD